MNKLHLLLSIVLLFFSAESYAQQDVKWKDKDVDATPLRKTSGLFDRAAGVHNASNIGLFFENRGKLYPRRLSDGPSGEYPINSGKHYIYRINPMVGIPGSVVQGRFTTNEEWEAVGGYHNPDGVKIAFSDNPASWHPTRGWPVKDVDGNPVIKSDQDSYCVYNDANNNRGALGIQMAQIGYAYGVKFAQNILFYKFEITNTSGKRFDSLYFNLYNDIDVGNASGGDPEYADDFIGFDKVRNFVYFYDDGYTSEWSDNKTGYFGILFLKTPKVQGVELGMTDMHYNLYDDDKDIDTVWYGLFSSSDGLRNSGIGNKFFHLGQSSNPHFDDPTTIPPTGLDIVANMSSGPYTLGATDTLVFYTAIVGGENLTDITATADQAKKILQYNFEISKPPTTPKLSAIPGNKRATLYWDDASEYSKDSYSGEYDFEGYRLYRSVDKGITWSTIAEYDLIDLVGIDRGLQYAYTDSGVTNGIEYWYTLTAYDKGDASVASLESPRGKFVGAQNLAVIIPRSDAIGRIPVSATSVLHSGRGVSNYVVDVKPVDNEALGNNQYNVGFTFVQRTEKGTLRTHARLVVLDSMRVPPHSYQFLFASPNTVNLVDMTTGLDVGNNPKSYFSGLSYTIQSGVLKIVLEDPDPSAAPEFLPKAGDCITVNFALSCARNGTDTVIAPRALIFEKPQATSDGVVLTFRPPEMIQNISKIAGSDLLSVTFTVARSDSIRNNKYLISTTGRGTHPVTGKPFISMSVKDSNLTTIKTVDTLFTLDSFEFRGVKVHVEFNVSSPPAAGNIYSLQTVVPSPPSILDKFSFGLAPSSTNRTVIAEQISKIRVVPNPYIVSSLYEPEFGELRREPLRQIQFTNLPSPCTISVFTVDASLVKTLHHTALNGTEPWDLRADGGREIAAGIYLFVVKSDAGEFLGRFAVIK
jgi:hypothetical protein